MQLTRSLQFLMVDSSLDESGGLIQKHQIFDHAKKVRNFLLFFILSPFSILRFILQTTLDMILFGDHLEKEEQEKFEAWENDNRKEKNETTPEVG